MVLNFLLTVFLFLPSKFNSQLVHLASDSLKVQERSSEGPRTLEPGAALCHRVVGCPALSSGTCPVPGPTALHRFLASTAAHWCAAPTSQSPLLPAGLLFPTQALPFPKSRDCSDLPAQQGPAACTLSLSPFPASASRWGFSPILPQAAVQTPGVSADQSIRRLCFPNRGPRPFTESWLDKTYSHFSSPNFIFLAWQ